ncbi:MAG TPA: phage tail protein [Pyrinomonadaceae bacterium]|jgi:phage tail-like protein|nr:phage tail protein [Pyrinomonadaceae bacterium]
MRCTTPEEFNYFTINTRAKWREGWADSVFIDREGQLSLTPLLGIGQSGQPGHATGLGVDHKGDLFIIDAEDCQIYKYEAEGGTLRRLECYENCGVEDRRPTCPGELRRPWRVRGLFGCGDENGQFKFGRGGKASGGLAFGKETLYVADTFNHRVQGFYLPQFQLRLVLGRKGRCTYVSGTGRGEFDQPKDLVTDSKENLYILDYGNRRIQKFNRLGKFLRFIGKGAKHALRKPESIAIDKEDFIYVIDSDTSTVEKFSSVGEWQGTPVNWPTDIPEQFRDVDRPTQPSAVAVDEDGIIYVGESGEGDDLRIHLFDQTLDPARRYLGSFGKYSGGCFKLIVDVEGRLYASCGPDGKVLLFSGEGRFEEKGAYYSKVFDSTIEACEWHRLALEVQSAEKSTLELFWRASDNPFDRDEKEGNLLRWQYLFSTPHGSVAVEDALFPKAVGRYLQLKFVFTGDGFHTHRVKRAQIYFQRLSYLRYLPATYQEDEGGRYFLERFLSIFESLSYETEQEIAGVAKYFDPEAVTSEFLEWLGTWLAVLRDHNWPEEKRRELLKRAFRLYKIRGTTRGLRQMIELFTGGETFIIEHHRLRTPMVLRANSILGNSTVVGKSFTKRLVLEESSRIGEFALIEGDEPVEKPFEVGAYDFTVFTDTSKLKTDAQMQALRRLIEDEKPAHTRYFLHAGGEAMQLGRRALLEVDTRLSKGFEVGRLGLTSRLGKGTFLGKRFRRRGVIGMRSTITVDAILQ